MVNLDTSFIVAALSQEATTRIVHDWLESHGTEHLAISDWTITEVSSALAVKLRTGSISLDQRAALAEAGLLLGIPTRLLAAAP